MHNINEIQSQVQHSTHASNHVHYQDVRQREKVGGAPRDMDRRKRMSRRNLILPPIRLRVRPRAANGRVRARARRTMATTSTINMQNLRQQPRWRQPIRAAIAIVRELQPQLPARVLLRKAAAVMGMVTVRRGADGGVRGVLEVRTYSLVVTKTGEQGSTCDTNYWIGRGYLLYYR